MKSFTDAIKELTRVWKNNKIYQSKQIDKLRTEISNMKTTATEFLGHATVGKEDMQKSKRAKLMIFSSAKSWQTNHVKVLTASEWIENSKKVLIFARNPFRFQYSSGILSAPNVVAGITKTAKQDV